MPKFPKDFSAVFRLSVLHYDHDHDDDTRTQTITPLVQETCLTEIFALVDLLNEVTVQLSFQRVMWDRQEVI